MGNKDIIKLQLQLQKQQNKEYMFALKNRRKIKKYYNYFLTQSEKVLNYLKEDYDVKFLKLLIDGVEETEKLSVHLKEVDDVFDQINKRVFPIRDLFCAFRVVRKYYEAYIYELHKKVLDETYKDINFNTEFDMLKESEQYVKYFIDTELKEEVEKSK